MAIVPMADAVFNTPASSSEYNKVKNNILDLDTRVTSLNSAVGGGLVKALYPTQTGSALTAAVSAETDIPKLAFTTVAGTNAALIGGNKYEFVYDLICSTSDPGAVFEFRLRKGAALTGTQIQVRRHMGVTNGNFGEPWRGVFSYPCVSNETPDFRLSVVRIGGTGTIQIYQDSTMFNFAKLYNMGVTGAGIVVDVA